MSTSNPRRHLKSLRTFWSSQLGQGAAQYPTVHSIVSLPNKELSSPKVSQLKTPIWRFQGLWRKKTEIADEQGMPLPCSSSCAEFPPVQPMLPNPDHLAHSWNLSVQSLMSLGYSCHLHRSWIPTSSKPRNQGISSWKKCYSSECPHFQEPCRKKQCSSSSNFSKYMTFFLSIKCSV